MSIISMTPYQVGQSGQLIQRWKLVTTDNLATITAAGYLNPENLMGYYVSPLDIFDVQYSYTGSYTQAGTGTYVELLPTISNSVITLNNQDSSLVAPVVVAESISSATPGTARSLVGKITQSATTMTSGNIVGVRGEVDLVGASGGFVYGAQGKVIPTGTLSGSSWTAGLFGQFDLSHPAVINAGQLAAVWGDWGTTGGTATNMTGARGYAFTNTTANVLNAQFYMYGPATYLLELDDNSGAYGTTYFKAAGTSAGSAGDTSKCNATEVLEISVNGTPYYIPLFAQNT